MAIRREQTRYDTGEFVRAFTLFDCGRHTNGATVLAWVDPDARLMLREPATGAWDGESYAFPASTITSVEVFDHDEGLAVRIDAAGTGTGGFILVGQPAALRSIVDDLRAAAARAAAGEERRSRRPGLFNQLRRLA